MKAALHAAKQDWQVWTIWYDDRLEGRVRDKTRELAYVRIEEALWDQGPAVVNAEIERRIAMSSYEDRLRGRTTDLEPELASQPIEEAISIGAPSWRTASTPWRPPRGSRLSLLREPSAGVWGTPAWLVPRGATLR
jgi:hypothetical protein